MMIMIMVMMMVMMMMIMMIMIMMMLSGIDGVDHSGLLRQGRSASKRTTVVYNLKIKPVEVKQNLMTYPKDFDVTKKQIVVCSLKI